MAEVTEEDYMEYLRAEVRSGNIKVDYEFYLFTTEDGLVVSYRGDFIPHGKKELDKNMTTMEHFLKDI